MTCPHLATDQTCGVISQIAGLRTIPHPLTCKQCSQVPTPTAVTVCAAMRARRAERLDTADLHRDYADLLAPIVPPEPAEPIRLENILRGIGVGSQLWQLLNSLGIHHRADCTCLTMAESMNRLGPAGCRRDRRQLVQQMTINAARYGWKDMARAAAHAIRSGLAWRLDLRDVYGSLLDEAIARATAAAPPVDILLVLGPGSRYKDLETRFALRSIHQYASGYRRVVIVGHIPAWLRETDQLRLVWRKEFRGNKAWRIAAKVQWSLETLDLTPRVAFWNDDYLLLQPVHVPSIPAIYRGSLTRDPHRNAWNRLLRHTSDALAAAGLPTRHYDIHIPILFDREKFLALTDWWARSRRHRPGYVMKSIYGNHYCGGKDQETAISNRDRKFQSNWQAGVQALPAGRWIVSYGDGALQTGFDQWMRTRFPTPHPAERHA